MRRSLYQTRGLSMSASVGTPLRLSLRRRIAYARAAVLIGVGVSFLALLGVDVYLHHRFERSAGFNVWGYRGAAAGRKMADEYRIVMLGGSTTCGYGTHAEEAIPAVLEGELSKRSIGPFRHF